MTAQVEDTVIHKGTEFRMIGVSGEGLYHPEEAGMKPVMIHTACYRGFYLTYDLSDSEGLVLQDLTLRDLNNQYPAVNGVDPEISEYQASYHELNLAVPFTGFLRLGTDFIQELYIHMGFQKPSSYRKVLDFQMEEGKIVVMKDRSEEAAAIRGGVKKKYHSGNVMDGIRDAFSLDMDTDLE